MLDGAGTAWEAAFFAPVRGNASDEHSVGENISPEGDPEAENPNEGGPWDWDFFQALRQIECANPDFARLGTSKTLRDDPARFGQFISLSFATSSLEKGRGDLAGGEPGSAGPNDARLKKLLVRFTGLTGPYGPLPLVLTEFIRRRLAGIREPDLDLRGENLDPGEKLPRYRLRDPALADFIDIFHHRLICLFYRAWAVANKTVDFDRHHLPGEEQSFADWIGSLFGQGTPEYDGLDGIPAWQKLAFAGQLANGTRHLDGLRGILAEVFTTRSEIEPLTGRWVEIPERERCRLGESPGTGTLGETCVIGVDFPDQQQNFSVRLGPMGLDEYRSFLPGGKARQLLGDWINFYTRREFDWDATILLQREEIPPLELSCSALDSGNQLGRTAWLIGVPVPENHPEDYRVYSES